MKDNVLKVTHSHKINWEEVDKPGLIDVMSTSVVAQMNPLRTIQVI